MIDNLKKILNEDQDPKAIEKITSKLANLLMSNEVVGYIAVQKKPAVTILPDSIVVTNKRIIICKPKNLGLSMEFVDYNWDDVLSSFVKENILGSEFSFNTKSDLTHTIDYLPKNQARKLYTYAKEQMDILKNGVPIIEIPAIEIPSAAEVQPEFLDDVEEVETEEVSHFAEIIPANQADYQTYEAPRPAVEQPKSDNSMANLSKEELFDKLQNYKKLLDNGLILQGEYDSFKKEILTFL